MARIGCISYILGSISQRKSFDAIYDLYGEDFNNMRKHGWSVLEHDFAKY